MSELKPPINTILSAKQDYKTAIASGTPKEEAWLDYLAKADPQQLLTILQAKTQDRYAQALNEYTHKEVKLDVYLSKRIRDTVYWYMQQLVYYGFMKEELPLSWFDKFRDETFEYEKDIVVPGATSEEIRPHCAGGRVYVNALYKQLHELCEEPIKSNPDIYARQ